MPWDNAAPLTPEELRKAVTLTFPNGDPPSGYEVVMCGRTRGRNAPVAMADLGRYEDAGLTTWLEAPPDLATLDEARAIILEGPPG